MRYQYSVTYMLIFCGSSDKVFPETNSFKISSLTQSHTHTHTQKYIKLIRETSNLR